MAVTAVIFDIDGTLLDTNDAHVEAWRRAFQLIGKDVPAEQIAGQIGKGGDKVVPDLLGREVEEEHGDELRQKSKEYFLEIARREQFRVFPGVPELLNALRDRRLKTALATSSSQKHLEAMLDSAGIGLQGMVDAVVRADDAEETKPSPDLVTAAVRKLQVQPAEAVLVGDTPYDAEAARRAGVACLGVLCGGLGHTAEGLRRAGAIAVYRDPADLLEHLDEALATAGG